MRGLQANNRYGPVGSGDGIVQSCLISALYAVSLIRNSVANPKAFCNSCMRVKGPASCSAVAVA